VGVFLSEDCSQGLLEGGKSEGGASRWLVLVDEVPADPSTSLRSGRHDKSEGGAFRWLMLVDEVTADPFGRDYMEGARALAEGAIAEGAVPDAGAVPDVGAGAGAGGVEGLGAAEGGGATALTSRA
jgi:hypothetical protein